MRKSFQVDNAVYGPFSPIFVCAVVFGVLIRFLEVYGLVTSSGEGVVYYWQEPTIDHLGLADLLFVCTLLILLVAILEGLRDLRNRNGWATFTFCLLLVTYSGGIRLFSQRIAEERTVTSNLSQASS